MAVTPDQIKQLRELSGAGVMDCKRALEEADGDLTKAQQILRQQGIQRAERRSDREAKAGVIESYIHHDRRLGAVVELNCETDFVARTDDFRKLAKEIALQVASMNPKYLAADEVPETEGTPDEMALLAQPFVRDGSKTIGQMVTEVSAKTGEKVAVGHFARLELGRGGVLAGNRGDGVAGA
jgi:elongation factor Ts